MSAPWPGRVPTAQQLVHDLVQAAGLSDTAASRLRADDALGQELFYSGQRYLWQRSAADELARFYELYDHRPAGGASWTEAVRNFLDRRIPDTAKEVVFQDAIVAAREWLAGRDRPEAGPGN